MLRRVPWAAISLIGFTTSAWLLNSGCQANDAGNFTPTPPSTVSSQGGTSASEGSGGAETEATTRTRATSATGPKGGAASASNPKAQGGSTSKSAAQGEGGEDATGGSTKGGTTGKASTTKGGSTSKTSTMASAKGGTKAASTTEEEPVDETPTEQTCTDDLMTLASGAKFNWIVNTSGKSCGVQGAIYAYGDGEGSLTSPAEAGSDWETPCVEDTGGVKCCVSGTTVADDTYAAWGFAIGLDLNATTAGKKSGYAGDAKGFTVKITVGELAAGQEIRIGYKQKTTDDISPFVGGSKEASTIKLTGTSGTFDVLFTDVSCPPAAWGTCTKPTSAPLGLEIQLPGTGTDATKVGTTSDFCITSIVPIL